MVYTKFNENIILRKKNIVSVFMFNDIYFSKISFKLNKIFKKPGGVFELQKFFFVFYKLFFFNFNKLLKNFNMLTFNKVKFNGKGYRIYQKKTFYIYAQLGYSHKLFLSNFNHFFKFSGKYRFFIFYINIKVSSFLKKILNWRFINIFTLRGFREFNQIIYKKKGKISSYR